MTNSTAEKYHTGTQDGPAGRNVSSLAGATGTQDGRVDGGDSPETQRLPKVSGAGAPTEFRPIAISDIRFP